MLPLTQEFNKIVDEIVKYTGIWTEKIPEPQIKSPVKKQLRC